jgi:hypothetical protein
MKIDDEVKRLERKLKFEEALSCLLTLSMGFMLGLIVCMGWLS